MTARETILAKIRRSLGVSDHDAARLKAMTAHLQTAQAGIIPAHAQPSDTEKVPQFIHYAKKSGANVTRINSINDVPHEILRYLEANNLPHIIRLGSDPLWASICFDSTEKLAQLTRLHGAAEESDRITLSHAQLGIAESGTVVLNSGPENPVTLNFLPEHHLVILFANDIVGSMEEAFTLLTQLTQRFGHKQGDPRENEQGNLPRTINFITGPSRSGDIEQKIIMGAHGPRALHIIVIGTPMNASC